MNKGNKASGLRDGFDAVLSGYLRAKTERFGKAHPMREVFAQLSAAASALEAVRSRPDVKLKWSIGQGAWATVPWVAALDTRETDKTSKGVYVIYLFRADMKGVYLTLNQGTSWLMGGYSRDGALRLHRQASVLRERVADELSSVGFTVGEGIQLASKAPLIRGYVASTVAFKLYTAGQVPSDKVLERDLDGVLKAYQRLVPTERFLGWGSEGF